MLVVFQKSPRLVLGEGLPELLLSVHDDGPVPGDGFFDRFSRDQQKPDPLLPSLNADFIAPVKQHQ